MRYSAWHDAKHRVAPINTVLLSPGLPAPWGVPFPGPATPYEPGQDRPCRGLSQDYWGHRQRCRTLSRDWVITGCLPCSYRGFGGLV